MFNTTPYNKSLFKHFHGLGVNINNRYLKVPLLKRTYFGTLNRNCEKENYFYPSTQYGDLVVLPISEINFMIINMFHSLLVLTYYVQHVYTMSSFLMFSALHSLYRPYPLPTLFTTISYLSLPLTV